MNAKSATSTAPIEIPTIAPVDNLMNNMSVQWIGLMSRKHISDLELPELPGSLLGLPELPELCYSD
jgi:hypothetical protein